jgi:hypothetical protein
MSLLKPIENQIENAYREMADKARYRPTAPSDGFGNIIVPDEELNLDAEAKEYAEFWWKEENGCVFNIGCCSFDTRPATIYAIEAARLMCGGSATNRPALLLLKMAVKQLEASMRLRSKS